MADHTDVNIGLLEKLVYNSHNYGVSTWQNIAETDIRAMLEDYGTRAKVNGCYWLLQCVLLHTLNIEALHNFERNLEFLISNGKWYIFRMYFIVSRIKVIRNSMQTQLSSTKPFRSTNLPNKIHEFNGHSCICMLCLCICLVYTHRFHVFLWRESFLLFNPRQIYLHAYKKRK